MAVAYKTLEQFTIDVDVSVDKDGILTGKPKDGQDKKIQALTQFMLLPIEKKHTYEADVAKYEADAADGTSTGASPIIAMGGSSNGVKSRRKRKSKKARKGKSLRRK